MSIVYLIGILLSVLLIFLISAMFLVFIDEPIVMALCSLTLGTISIVLTFALSLINKGINLLPNSVLEWLSYGEVDEAINKAVNMGYIASGVVLVLSLIFPFVAKVLSANEVIKYNSLKRYFNSKRALKVRK